MSFLYEVYGLRLQSHSRIPGLQPTESTEADVQIELGRPLSDVLASLNAFEEEKIQFEGHGLTFGVMSADSGKRLYHWTYQDDGTEFLVDGSGTHIWADWYEKETVENAASYLVGPILAFVLRLRGITSLHASVVSMGECAIALLGPPGSGKSTTAMSLVLRGHALLTDSVTTLELTAQSGFQVRPGFPRVRLWPDSARLLFGSQQHLAPILSRTECWPDWNKCYVDLTQSSQGFSRNPLVLAAIYALSPPDGYKEEVVLQSVTPQEGLVELLANEYSNYLPYHQLNRRTRAREFETLVRLATLVPLRRVLVPADRVPPDELCNRILEDFDSLRPPLYAANPEGSNKESL